MKVGTDGVLLGAWANFEQATHILDMGCGTGLLSLMAAQRNSNAFITAAELENGAAKQAFENVKASPWSNRIEVLHVDILSSIFDNRFDCIVCNPPYFTAAILPTVKARSLARHNTNGFETWIETAFNLCSNTGIANFIFPIEQKQAVLDYLKTTVWHIHRICEVIPNDTKPAVRFLLELRKVPCETQYSKLQIETDVRGSYHPDYKNLTADFYLWA
jgi:tRNA1Val (adenine37-N6)-methyltransferase